jgi:TonB family protein
VVTTPSFGRAACWLFSAGAHVAVLAAAGHSPYVFASAPGDRADALAIDIEPELTPEVGDPSASSADTRPGPFVPRDAPARAALLVSVGADPDARRHDAAFARGPAALAVPTFEETIVAAPFAPARFTMTVSSEDRRGPTEATGANVRAAGDDEAGSDGAPLPEEGVSRAARLATSMSPAYPAAARAQEIEADVVLAIVVASTGEVIDARVLKTAGYGFDQEALSAVRVARFFPAERDGRRVAVRMRWSVSFRLR